MFGDRPLHLWSGTQSRLYCKVREARGPRNEAFRKAGHQGHVGAEGWQVQPTLALKPLKTGDSCPRLERLGAST